MTIIEIKALSNGGHRNQTDDFVKIPQGWAVVPDDLKTDNFPFGEAEATEVDGVMTVTNWTPLDIPETEPTAEPITLDERISALESAVLELALGGTE